MPNTSLDAIVPMLCVILAALAVMGVFPALFLKPMEASVDALVQRVQAVQPVQVRNGR